MGRQVSKSRMTTCAKCPKNCWLAVHAPHLADERDKVRAQAGTEVGELARGYFGEHTLIEFDNSNFGGMLSATKKALSEGVDVIAEAAFSKAGMFCMADILKKDGDKYDLVEVKSSTMRKGVDDKYLLDVAFQYRTIEAAGVPLGRAFIMHPDASYTREGELEIRKFFKLEDVSDAVAEILSGERELETPHGKTTLDALLDKTRSLCEDDAEEPTTKIGPWCVSSYECDFKSHCWSNVPDGTPLEFTGMTAAKRFKLYSEYKTMADAAEAGVKLNARQVMQAATSKEPLSGTRIVPEKIAEFLETVRYPLYHLDFETMQPIIPMFDGTRPYEQVPTQYSLHIQAKPRGACEHREFLAIEGTDPRRTLAERLVEDIPVDACTIAWNMSFEKSVIRRLAASFPDLFEHLMAIHDNMVDLMVPFKDGWWCSPAQCGSYSIKKVLPAMFPDDAELDYSRLEGVHNGSEAMDAYLTLALKSPDEIAEIREQLLRYCELDTWAMVRVLGELERYRGVGKE